MTGLAFDGQYFDLAVPEHLTFKQVCKKYWPFVAVPVVVIIIVVIVYETTGDDGGDGSSDDDRNVVTFPEPDVHHFFTIAVYTLSRMS